MAGQPLTSHLQTEQLVNADEASPFAVAYSAGSQETLYMVRKALQERRMRLAYQPAVYAADPSIIGFYEGYIRLLDDNGQVIPARAFMEISENHALGREIDLAALRLGIECLQQNSGVRIAVNMSARSIGYQPFIDTLRQGIARNPEIGRSLILEINEASAMQMPDVLIPFMSELRNYGLTFTLDDFGAGLTSLELLNEFAFDIAKIDQKFIRNCHIAGHNQPIARAAIAMAREFGMFLVAEAVETLGEANWLAEQGVGCLQGYLFGRPEVAPDFSLFRLGRQSS